MSINSSGNLVEMASYGKGQTRAFFVFFFLLFLGKDLLRFNSCEPFSIQLKIFI